MGIRAGRAFVELGVDDKIAKGLEKAKQRLEAFGKGLRSLGLKLSALGSSAVTFLGGSVKAFTDIGDSLDEMSARTGVSVETLSELGYAAELAGGDLETLEAGLRKMQRTIGDAATGSESAVEALSRLGLSVEDVLKLNPEQQFKLIADRLSKISDPTLRAALAMEVFGKTGTRLLPLIQDGAKGLEEYQRQARALGLTVSTETAKDAALLDDALRSLWRVLKQSAFTIGAALAPTIQELAGTLTRVVVRVTEWLRQNKAAIVTALQVAAAVTAAGFALVAAGTLISGLGAVFGWLATAVRGVGTVIGALGPILGALVSPIGLVVTAVAGLGTAILVYSGAGADALAWLGDTFRWLKDGALAVVGGIADALAAGDLTLAAQVLWAGLKLAWEQGTAVLEEIWNKSVYAFQQVAAEAFAGLRKAWINVASWMWRNFPETTAFLSKTWTNFISDLQSAWRLAQNWLTKRFLELQHLFDDSFNLEEAKRMADEEFADMARKIEDQRTAAIVEADRKSKLTNEEHEKERLAALEEVEQDKRAALERAKASHIERIAASQAELDKAKADLDAARAAAAAKRQEGEAAAPSRRTLVDPLAGLDDRISGLADLLARKLSVTGTFNPLAIAGLAAGNAEERTAQNTEQIARHTKRLADAAAVGRLSFA
jgi:hypothetical protein